MLVLQSPQIHYNILRTYNKIYHKISFSFKDTKKLTILNERFFYEKYDWVRNLDDDVLDSLEDDMLNNLS